MQPYASIVVVNHNGAHHLPSLLQHLTAQTESNFELFVVDNGSVDSSRKILQAVQGQLPFSLSVICNSINRGFGPATNQGIVSGSAPWVATLNNDTRPEADWLEQMLIAVESSAGAGMVASKLLRLQNPQQIDSTGIAMDHMGIAWDRRGGEMDSPVEADIEPVFGPCAGAALYSRHMLNRIGLFDGDFFAYLEDVDLAWRARLAGYEAMVQPKARALHVHSATLGDSSPVKRYLLGRNKVWLIAKNYPIRVLMRHLAGIVTYDLAATLYGTVQHRDGVTLRGRMAGMAKLPYFLGKRRDIQRRFRDVDNWRAAVSPTVAPWRVANRYADLQQ